MTKGLTLMGVCMMLLLVGCTSESREADMVTRVIDLCDQTTAKVSALSDAIDQAIKKADPDKGISLKEAIDACDALKSYCKKELQPEALKIQLLQASSTDADKAKLRERFQNEIDGKIKRLNDRSLILNAKVKELQSLAQDSKYSGSKDAVDTFVTKNYAEAQEEYNSLNRQIR